MVTMHSPLDRQSGFSFIEVLVFITIVSFLFITLTATVISSLSRMKLVEHRMYATHHAEELLEWLRAEKDADWNAFVARDSTGGSGTSYCFNTELDFISTGPLWEEIGSGLDTCAFDGVRGSKPRIFRRYAQIQAVSPEFNTVNVRVIVEWREGSRYYSVPLNSTFTDLNENTRPTPTPI
ncbi:MAG: prepilin-type N-terminal cleavage/methylation domain-containing protein [Patescibacteria group bacterium]|nr:prepilin-type N-terminal cleavage/methylation domain-containing protein [Patescibacteria group bacterium]